MQVQHEGWSDQIVWQLGQGTLWSEDSVAVWNQKHPPTSYIQIRFLLRLYNKLDSDILTMRVIMPDSKL